MERLVQWVSHSQTNLRVMQAEDCSEERKAGTRVLQVDLELNQCKAYLVVHSNSHLLVRVELLMTTKY